jgi:hypothetical protein
VTTSDDRVLHVFFGTPETEEEAEDRIRESLRRAGVGPGGPDLGIPPMPPHPPAVPPEGEEERPGLPHNWRMRFPWALKPEQDNDDVDEAPARASNDRLPDWRDPHKPDLADLDDDQDEPGEDDEPDEDEPKRKPKARGPRPSQRPVSKTDSDDEDDPGEDDEAVQKAPTGPRWSRPAFVRPPGLPEKRHNLFTWWREIEPYQKWLAFNGTALAGGIWIGGFSYGFAGAEFVETHDPLDINVLATYGLGGLVLLLDYRIRNWFPPAAWAARGISASVVLGAIWHSTPLADLGH